MPPPAEVQEAEGKIIGLEGRPLSPSTWRDFRADGTNPRVAVWAHRVENGESVEQIARESGYSITAYNLRCPREKLNNSNNVLFGCGSSPRWAVSKMKGMISNYRLYFKVCKLNGIVPEGDADV